MSHRLRLAAKLALILTLAAPLAIAQNTNTTTNGPGAPGGAPGGGGRGGPGGGPGGWGGGPGGGGPGGGTSPAALVLMPVVQDDLKLTDKQKDQVKQINDDSEKQRVVVREKAQKMANAAREQAAQEAAAAAEANGGTPFDPNANANNNNGGGRGNRGRNDPGAQVSRQVMDEFQAKVETALLKPLDPKQKTRIKQISLQAEGVRAFTTPEVIEKLGMTEEQVDIIQSIVNDSRQNGRQLMGQLFNNGNNNGGPGGGGQRGGPPDPATLQTPEFQAKLKDLQSSQQKLDDQTMSSVGKALTKAQRATFQKMVGEKFDVAQLRRGFFDRFRPAGTPAATPTATASAATPAATAATPAPTTAAPAAKEAAKPARKSLRDARGGPSTP